MLQSQAQGTQVTVDYATANGSATAGSNYTAIATSTLTFARGDGTQVFYVIRTVSVPVADDTTDETFTITLSNQTTGVCLFRSAATAMATIEDDDPPPTATIAESGAGNATTGDCGSARATGTRTRCGRRRGRRAW